jgi:cytochrome c553
MRLVGAASAAIIAVHGLGPAAAAQDPTAGRTQAAVCAACHGPDGNSSQPLYPALAGQTARYIYLQLKDFKEGRRSDSLMSPMAKNLSQQDMFDLAAYFSAQQRRPLDFKADPKRVARGEQKVAETLCTMCHLGGMMGQNEIPRVAGQHYEYVVKQLKDFKEGRRTNDAGNMSSVSKTISDEDIINLGHYLANLN